MNTLSAVVQVWFESCLCISHFFAQIQPIRSQSMDERSSQVSTLQDQQTGFEADADDHTGRSLITDDIKSPLRHKASAMPLTLTTPLAQGISRHPATPVSRSSIFEAFAKWIKDFHSVVAPGQGCRILEHMAKFDSPPGNADGATFHCHQLFEIVLQLPRIESVGVAGALHGWSKTARLLGLKSSTGTRLREWVKSNHIMYSISLSHSFPQSLF